MAAQKELSWTMGLISKITPGIPEPECTVLSGSCGLTTGQTLSTRVAHSPSPATAATEEEKKNYEGFMS